MKQTDAHIIGQAKDKGMTDLNIKDYLSEEELKEIAIAKAGDLFERWTQRSNWDSTNIENLISNAAYSLVFKKVNELLNGDMEEMIVENTVKIIKELSSYCVFHNKDIYGKEHSKAQKIMNKAVEDNADMIENRVKEIIKERDYSDIKEQVHDAVYEIIDNGLFTNKEAAE